MTLGPTGNNPPRRLSDDAAKEIKREMGIGRPSDHELKLYQKVIEGVKALTPQQKAALAPHILTCVDPNEILTLLGKLSKENPSQAITVRTPQKEQPSSPTTTQTPEKPAEATISQPAARAAPQLPASPAHVEEAQQPAQRPPEEPASPRSPEAIVTEPLFPPESADQHVSEEPRAHETTPPPAEVPAPRTEEKGEQATSKPSAGAGEEAEATAREGRGAQPTAGAGGAELASQARASAQRELTDVQRQAVAKGGVPGSWGFSDSREQSVLIQRVGLMSLLMEGKESSLMRSMGLLQSLSSISKQLAAASSQMEQLIAKEGVLTAKQTTQFTAQLTALQKQLQEGLKEMQRTNPELQAGKEAGRLPGNPLPAALLLKERADQLLSQAAAQAQEKMEALANRLNPHLAKEGVQPGTARPAAGTPTAPLLGQPQKESSALSLQPQLGRPGEAASARSQAAPLPLSIRSSAELQTLAAQLQAKTVNTPMNIALVYPLEKSREIQTPLESGDVEASKKKEREEEEEQKGFARRKHVQAMVLVPGGPAIIGDPFGEGEEDELPARVVELSPFLIAIHPITNGQYADWLNDMTEKGTIQLTSNGAILDHHRRLLFQTQRAKETSQIQVIVSKGTLLFDVLPGTELNPVSHVSWFGADAYCAYNGLRLPTEAEWEKAAGMKIPSEGELLTKFRYGFGGNEIDPTWANYREGVRQTRENETTPIGFFNGKSIYVKGKKSYTTQNAMSPYGCYDMSGNVRQWVSDGDTDKVAKGGSYNTPIKELRVSARALQHADACLPDTGFRVAIDLS